MAAILTYDPMKPPRCECNDIVDISDGPVWCAYHDWWQPKWEQELIDLHDKALGGN